MAHAVVYHIATTNLLPNVVMAFVIIQALKITGLLGLGSHIRQPVMGLPGEAATVLWLLADEYGGAVGVAASSATAGALKRHDARTNASHLPDGENPVQNVGRCLGTAEVNAKYYPAYYRSSRPSMRCCRSGSCSLLFNKELSCLIYPPWTLLQGAHLFAPEDRGICDTLLSRMAKFRRRRRRHPRSDIAPDRTVINLAVACRARALSTNTFI